MGGRQSEVERAVVVEYATAERAQRRGRDTPRRGGVAAVRGSRGMVGAHAECRTGARNPEEMEGDSACEMLGRSAVSRPSNDSVRCLQLDRTP